MTIRHPAGTAAAVLLVGTAALNAVLGSLAGPPQPAAAARAEAARPLVPMSSRARSVLESCEENVAIVHDVYWAAACMSNADDDSPDCTLPDARALPLNVARAAAEQECLAEADAAERMARRSPQ